jgi:predicted membrane protein
LDFTVADAGLTTFGHVTWEGQFVGTARSGKSGAFSMPFSLPEDWATDCLLDLEEYKKMPLINLVIALIVVGVALYLINRYIPMASSIKMILNVVVVCAVGIWVLQSVGLWGDISSYRLRR